MKALFTDKYGSPDFLEIREVPKPKPERNQVLIKVKAVSVNDWDWGLLNGSPFIPNRFMAGLIKPNITIGSDIAGVIEEVGCDVTIFKPGDHVYGDLSGIGFGGLAEYVCASQNDIRLKSTKMTFEQAAAIPQAGMLAFQAVQMKETLKPGQSVLINGAGGGVGSIAIQILKLRKLEVTGVDSEEKLTAMKSWGFDHVIDYRSEDFTRNGQCYDLIIDVKTDRTPADYEKVLKSQGVYATVGGLTASLIKVAISGFRISRAKDKKLKVVWLEANRELEYFNKLFEAGQFMPVIDAQFAFTNEQVREAFHRYGRAEQKGKYVISI